MLPLLTLALRAEAELAHHARTGRDEAAEREAISRASALLNRARALTAPDAWPLGSPPAEMLLEAELCELETRRAGAEASAAAWSALAGRWAKFGRPFQAAYAWLREAEAALAENLPRDRVAAALGSAYASATRLGARPLLEEIEHVSRRARIRVAEHESEEAASEVAGLTARELDVLRLIAEGRTNREIGEALYISPKTASVHVSWILSKLDVKTRAQAARAARRLRLLDTRS